MDTIRVGIVGATPERGWGGSSHVPAIHALPNMYTLAAVSTSKEETARTAAEAFGAVHAFANAIELARHPDVELVAVVVKVPEHFSIVRVALEAGKHVLCEWPLALDTDDAVSLYELARVSGVHHAVGLQSRCSPVLTYARDLVSEGFIGRVTSITAYSATPSGAGGVVPVATAYSLDARNGASVLEIATGHMLDAIEFLVGPFATLSADVSVQQAQYALEGSTDLVPSNAPNHVLVSAQLASGGVASVHVHNGKATHPRTWIEISGAIGDLTIEAEGPRAAVQMGDLRLRGASGIGKTWNEISVPAKYFEAPQTSAKVWINVAQLYARLASDIRAGSRTVPDFGIAVATHRLLDAVRSASQSGTRVEVISQKDSV